MNFFKILDNLVVTDYKEDKYDFFHYWFFVNTILYFDVLFKNLHSFFAHVFSTNPFCLLYAKEINQVKSTLASHYLEHIPVVPLCAPYPQQFYCAVDINNLIPGFPERVLFVAKHWNVQTELSYIWALCLHRTFSLSHWICFVTIRHI